MRGFHNCDARIPKCWPPIESIFGNSIGRARIWLLSCSFQLVGICVLWSMFVLYCFIPGVTQAPRNPTRGCYVYMVWDISSPGLHSSILFYKKAPSYHDNFILPDPIAKSQLLYVHPRATQYTIPQFNNHYGNHYICEDYDIWRIREYVLMGSECTTYKQQHCSRIWLSIQPYNVIYVPRKGDLLFSFMFPWQRSICRIVVVSAGI